ncbi:MAG TPA: glucosyl-3-phosphoglycerate synthase [Streptosporangiaceae bacterium]|jgi:glucosyl-3-phosphoglycerate synthase|nr:glucosyl-3-phosphoglycerate synthase [Streptosporangiaceae bacterium]
MDITVWEWFEQRSFHFRDFRSLTEGADRLPLTTTLVLPTRNTAGTIGPILDTVARLNDRTGLIEQVVVVDADSPDGTAGIARAHGAEVYSENELLPEYGRAHGKGDAMWRSLSVARGDLVMFADSDSTDFQEHFVYGTLGPLLTNPAVQFSKAAFRRPFSSDGKAVVDGGGRVTELMAKPLLNFFYPELTGFVQPLAGEFAARRELLCGIPFATGYGVEIAMMVDVLNEVGLAGMAQVDLETRQNRHQPLFDLTRMSSAVLRALGHRVHLAGRGAVAHDPSEMLALPQRDVYLHAVGTPDGLRLDEHLVELLERPPLTHVLATGEERETVA